MTEKSITLDELDHQVLHALQVDARVPFARLAEMVDVSEQTVARRFHRLRSAGIVRVVGGVDPTPLGEPSWIVRIQARPDGAVALADALARRVDVGWISLVSGGSEIICVIRSRSIRQRDELLLQRLPKTAQVMGVRAYSLMHRFGDVPWTPGSTLRPNQIDELRAQAIGGGVQSANTWPTDARVDLQLSETDEILLAELGVDGRTPINRLAQLSGWTAARVNRRLDELVRSGLLYFDTEMALAPVGFRSLAFIWGTVPAGALQATGEELAGHDEAAFVAATTGATNLFASVVCRDTTHLYRYVTDRLGALTAITGLEISPSLRRVKQGGSMMTEDRITAG